MSQIVKEVPLFDIGLDRLTAYAKQVVLARAVADYRDGFKPVHRRILWAMHKGGFGYSGKFVKCARIVGDTIGLYHPHGDCLHGDTRIALCNGQRPKIKQLLGRGSFWVWSLNEKTGTLEPALAHSWRVGQVTDKIYRVTLSTGDVIECSGNHPFYNPVTKKWVKADRLEQGTQLFGVQQTHQDYPVFRWQGHEEGLHVLAGRYQHGSIETNEVYHHKNENTQDNRPTNFEPMDRAVHAKHHGDFTVGLTKGRESMFGDKGIHRDATRRKNKALAKQISKNYGLYKVLKGFRLLLDRGQELTPANYENLRQSGEIYNLVTLEKMLQKGYSFEDLLSYLTKGVPFDNSSAVGHTIKKTVKERVIPDNEPGYLHKAVAAVLDELQNPSWADYDCHTATLKQYSKSVRSNWAKTIWTHSERVKKRFGVRTIAELKAVIGSHHYCAVENVEIIQTASQPLYDFTVPGNENLLISVGRKGKKENLIVAHNSSIYDAMVGMIRSSVPLILGQGGFGNHRDGPAAYRYTEAKMSKLTDRLIFGGDYIETVPLIPNYDDSEKEPVFLPALFPNLLLNGCQGIAYGVAANIPPMHPEPVLALVKRCLKGEKITAEKMMKTIRFNWPNHSVCASEDAAILAWLENGKGALHFQPPFEYDERKRTVTITSIPPNFNYESTYDRFIEKPWCVDFEDLTDVKSNGPRFRIKIKGGNEDFEARVKDTVRMFTNTFSCSTTVVTNGKTLEETNVDKITIPDFFPWWCAYRIQLERDYQAYRVSQFLKDIARQDLLLLVIKHLEAVSKIVKNSTDPRQELMGLLQIDREQVDVVMTFTLGGLTRLSSEKIKEKKAELQAGKKQAIDWQKTPTPKVLSDLDAQSSLLSVT